MIAGGLPVLSVVVPAYNHERFIASALESVGAQSYPGPIELMVMDDASTDDTHAVADRVLQRLRSHRPWASMSLDRHDRNQGAPATIAEAISRTSGPLIAVLNSDDCYTPTRLESLVNAMHEQQSEFGFTNVTAIGDDGRILRTDTLVATVREFIDHVVPGLPSLEFGFLRHQLTISSGNMVFTRRLYERVGGFSALRYVHDWDFALAAILLTRPTFLSDEFYGYRIHESNSHATLAAIAETETEVVLKRFFQRILRGGVTNRRAPSARYWPGVFEQYLAAFGIDTHWNQAVEALPRYART